MTDAKTLRERHAAALNDAIEATLAGDMRGILAAHARLASARAALAIAPASAPATSPFDRERRGGGE